MKYDHALFLDMLAIGGDAALGVALGVILFARPTEVSVIFVFFGACAGILPDLLQFAYTRFPREPLTSLQQFHGWIHTSRRMSTRPILGIISQFAFLAVSVVVARALLR